MCSSDLGITSGNDVSLRDSGALDLAASTVSGTLLVVAGGAITDSGVLAVSGLATFAAGSGNNITLDAVNNFSAVAITSGNNVTLNDAGAIDLAASTVSGNLVVTAGGAVGNTGKLDITGTTSVTAKTTGPDTYYNVSLGEATNDFTGAVSLTGLNVAVVNGGALLLGPGVATDTYSATAAIGNITQQPFPAQGLTVTGLATFKIGRAHV